MGKSRVAKPQANQRLPLHRVQSLQPGVRLTAIFDSCHSGSALDLPYIYSTQGVLKEPNLAKEAGQGLLGIVSSYARGDIGGMASTAMSFFKKATTGDETFQRNLRTKTSPADVIMWSGSKDSQTSYVLDSSLLDFPLPLPDSSPIALIHHPSFAMFPDEPSFGSCKQEACSPPGSFTLHRDINGNVLL